MNTLQSLRLQFIFCLCLLAVSASTQSVVIPETVKSKCEGLNTDSKLRLAVARFSQSFTGSDRNVENFSTMLSNAMFEIECFRMLSMLNDRSYNYKGKEDRDIMPHFIITGEITEYSHKTDDVRFGVGKKSTITAHIGFVLQIVDPVTREVVFSKSFDHDGTSDSALKLKIRGIGTGSVSETSTDKAYFDAFEHAWRR